MGTSLVFLTPAGGFLAFAALLPLAGLALAARRERRAQATLGLPAPPPQRRLPRAAAAAAVTVVLAVAAAQPALRRETTLRIRTDAEALFILDTSLSMQAATSPTAPTRFARAKADAIALRSAIAEVPSGVATFTDRVLPDLLPNPDPAVFDDTVEHAVGIDEPPPANDNVIATTLGALGAVESQNFFPPSARRRLVVVLTDGESRPFDPQQVARALARRPGTRLILIHVWKPGERLYEDGRADPSYHEDAQSAQALGSLASASGGAVFGEQSLEGAIRAERADLGTGPTVPSGQVERTRTLALYVALVALLPLLALVLPGLRRAPLSPRELATLGGRLPGALRRQASQRT